MSEPQDSNVARRSRALKFRFVDRPVFRRERSIVARLAGVEAEGEAPKIERSLATWYDEYMRTSAALPRERIAPGTADGVARRIALQMTAFMINGRFSDPRAVRVSILEGTRDQLAEFVEASTHAEGEHRGRLHVRSQAWLEMVTSRLEVVRARAAERMAADPAAELTHQATQLRQLYRGLCYQRSAVAFVPATLAGMCRELDRVIDGCRQAVPGDVARLVAIRERWGNHHDQTVEKRSNARLESVMFNLELELQGIERSARMRYFSKESVDDTPDVLRMRSIRYDVFRLVEIEKQLWSLLHAFEADGTVRLLRRVYDLEVRLAGAWTRNLSAALTSYGASFDRASLKNASFDAT